MDTAPRVPQRPGELAAALMASGEWMPRQRARDQEADRIGLCLARQVFEAIAQRDPASEELELTLDRLVAESAEPRGPLRAMCREFVELWHASRRAPHLLPWLETRERGSVDTSAR